jgi:membrane-bound serine protease (ClpP class)
VILGLLLTLLAPRLAAEVHVLDFDGAVGPATADLVIRAIEDAEAEGAELFVIRMDTPGGLDAAMRDIIKAILDADVPVATFVAPSGSRAASAGTYILYASHVAAMAPATNLGAATPVAIGGGGGPMPTPGPAPTPTPGPDGADEGAEPEASDGEDGAGPSKAPAPATASERKAINDAVAYIRGLAELRGRDADWAEAAVRDAASLSSEAALERGVIEHLVADVPALLEAVDGRTVEVASGPRTLATAGAATRTITPDWRTKVLAAITDPNVAYILLMIGIYGLILEFYNPGLGIAGVTGVVCLLLGAYALQMMPVSYAGLALLVVGVGLMVTEAFSPSFGVFGIGGVVAFVLGSLLLFDTEAPAWRVSIPVIAAFAAASVAIFVFTIAAALKVRAQRPVSGRESVVGDEAVALADFGEDDEAGRVRLQGEIWHARASAPVRRGETVTVTALDGLVVTVAPASAEALGTGG